MKKLHRFLVSTLPDGPSYSITDTTLVHQIGSVLRYKPGEQCILFAQHTDDVVVTIQSLSKKEILVNPAQTIPARTSASRYIVAAVSIIKRDLFELVVQKLTELGVREIVPIISHRTIKQSIKPERLEAIAREAIEQSGQSILPIIHPPTKLADALVRFPMQTIVFDPYQPISTDPLQESVIYYIGPEGGWGEKDDALFQSRTVHYRTLGNTILRAETAAIVGAYELLR